MSGPQALLNLETAPRNLEGLVPLGIYQHRRLVEEIEAKGIQIFENDRDKSAFFSTDTQSRAQRLLDALNQVDAANGGAPVKAAPTRQPVTAPQAPAQLAAPPAQAAPPQAAQVAAPAPARQPKTNGASTNGAATPVAGVAELLLVIKSLQTELASLKTTLFEHTVALKEVVVNQNTAEQKLNDLGSLINGSLHVQELNSGLLALLGEQSLGAPKEVFIPDALRTAADVMTALTQAGKD